MSSSSAPSSPKQQKTCAPAEEAELATELPVEVAAACASGDPWSIFAAGTKHFEPVAMGMVIQPPYSGGPLLGFELPLSGGGGGTIRAVLNGFACVYFDDKGSQTTAVFGINDVVKLQFTCFSSALARAIASVDPAASERAARQVAAFASAQRETGAREGARA